MDRTGDFGSVRPMCHLPRFGPGPRLCGTPRQLTDQLTNREIDYTLKRLNEQQLRLLFNYFNGELRGEFSYAE